MIPSDIESNWLTFVFLCYIFHTGKLTEVVSTLVSNSLDPDQTPRYASSHQDPNCLQNANNHSTQARSNNTVLLLRGFSDHSNEQWTACKKGDCQCSGSPLSVAASESPSSFTSIGYPTSYSNNLNCEWLIDSGVAGQRIIAYSDHLDIDCSFGDTLNIYDGSSTTATLLQSTLCGVNLLSTEYLSSDRYILVTFTTDSANAGQGFSMTYLSATDTSATGCTAEYTYTASSSAQYLTSAGFPSKYSSDSSCRWLVTAPGSLSTISVEIVWSDIEDDTNCKYDKLVIYDGRYICENKMLGTDCSTRTAAGSTPTTYTTTSNSVLFIFTSDDSYNRYGFVIKYTANIVYTSTTTTVAATTVAGNTSDISSSLTNTEKELNVTMMAVSALAGSVTSLFVVGLIFVIKHLLTRKTTKLGVMTVQSIAPLPPRATHFTNHRPTTLRNNALSFV